ncbi:MAG TPA: AAA family ATPase [Pseudonocardiaceae bacterium]|nr:AAA family ATPase [Pseudonocardiaceae bacterium]
MTRLPMLWLCGPPGVGKSAVAWELFGEWAGRGIRLGYVDIDQLGMCYPDPADDPDRHRLKLRALAAVVANFRAAGARCVVVSGVVDPARGVLAGDLPSVALTVCRLRCAPEELVRRFVAREARPDLVDSVLAEAELLDAKDFASSDMDTSGLGVAGVARLVREWTGWPVLADPVDEHVDAGSADGGRVLLLCGARGVGKSTVGFEVCSSAPAAGRTAAFVDLEQIGFCRPGPVDHRLTAANLVALWRVFRERGAEFLVAGGQVADVEPYTEALPGITVHRLHAGPSALAERIARRGLGEGPALAGEGLRGQPVEVLDAVARTAAAQAEALECASVGARIDTEGRTVAEVAEAIRARVNFV